MPEYLKVDSRKLEYREYWNIVRSPLVVVPWIAKLLGIPMQFGSPVPRPGSQREMEIAEEQLSPVARMALRRNLDECLSLGFFEPRYFYCQTLRGETKTAMIGLLHHSGRFSARLFHSRGESSGVTVTTNLVVYLSELSDRTYFVSSNEREMFKPAPFIVVNRIVRGTPSNLLKSHEQKLAELELRNPPKRVNTALMLDDAWDRYEQSANEFGIQRGVYVPVTLPVG